MSYTHVQFIAYEVPTGVGLPAGTCGLDGLELCAQLKDDPDFTGAVKGLKDDARARLGRLLGVIQAAMSSKAVKAKDEHTLKVFMAPEFYFRPEKADASRSYPAAEMFSLQAALRRIFAQDLMDHWVFVLGTIVWNLKGKIVLSDAMKGVQLDYAKALQQVAEQDVLYNTAMVAVGGYGLQLYDKLHYSPDDDIASPYQAKIQKEAPESSGTSFDLAVDDPKLRTALFKYFEVSGANSIKQCIIPAGGVWCGLEVCLDHDLNVLARSYTAFKNTWPNKKAPPLDLQLLIACGMPVRKGSVIVGKDRYIFRVDGAVKVIDDFQGRFDHSELRRVTAADKRGFPTAIVNPFDSKKDWDALNDPAEATVLSGDLRMKADGLTATLASGKEDLDGVFKQRLVVYQQLKLNHLAA